MPIYTKIDDDYDYDEEMTTAVSHNSEQVTVMQYLADTDVRVQTLHKCDIVIMFLVTCMMQCFLIPLRWSVYLVLLGS